MPVDANDAGALTPGAGHLAEVGVDGQEWAILMEWAVRLGAWVWTAAAVKRRRAADPYAAILQALRQLPAGGEAGGALPGGASWYVRVPPAGRKEQRDDG